MECDCYLRNVQDFLTDGKTPCERRFGEPTIRKSVQSIWSNGWISSDFNSRSIKTSLIWKESFARKTSGICIDRDVNLACKRSALTIMGISMRTEVCQICGLVSQKLLYWKRNLPRNRCGPGETDKSSDDYETRSCVVWGVDKSQQSKAKTKEQELANEKPKLERARRIRGRKLKVHMETAMPCKKKRLGAPNKVPKPKYACVVESLESTRQRVELTLERGHEDNITEKLVNFTNRYNWVHIFIPMQKAMTIPDAKASVEEEWKKLETIQAWKLDKVKSKKEVILEAQWNKSEVHLASLMDSCHLKSGELEPKFQKYKGRVVLRGDIVKDHSGAYAVFTEQGSSASQMTEAKVMEYNGQAANAISAHTQVKMEDAPKLFRIPKSGPDIWIRIPRHWFLLNETCTDTHLRDYHGKGSFEKILLELACERVPNW